jgi:hypothetical protein
MTLLKNYAHLFLVLSFIMMGACTKESQPTSPEAALDRYVKTAFGAKNAADQKILFEMSDGDAADWLASMSKELFQKQFIENQMQLVSMKTSEKREEKDDRVSIVYELVFKDGKTSSPMAPDSAASPATYTNKKIAYLKKMDGAWKITATKNVKTFIDRKDALEVPPLSVLPPEGEEEKPAPKSK